MLGDELRCLVNSTRHSDFILAAARLRTLWQTGRGVISVQVMQEFYVNVTRKIPQPLALPVARELVEAYSAWQVESPSAQDVLRASEIQERYQLSFRDAMIVVTAINGGADLILSEDLNDGQLISGVQIENPFKTFSPTSSPGPASCSTEARWNSPGRRLKQCLSSP